MADVGGLLIAIPSLVHMSWAEIDLHFIFHLVRARRHPLMTHFRVSDDGSYLAPSFPLLPPRFVRSRPDLHGPVRHACDLFPIPFFVGNPRSFSFNSPRNRKKSRGSQVLGIVSFLLTSASFRNGIVAGFYFHSHPLMTQFRVTNDALPRQ